MTLVVWLFGRLFDCWMEPHLQLHHLLQVGQSVTAIVVIVVAIMVSIMITIVTSVVIIRLIALRILSSLSHSAVLKLQGITTTNVPALQHY